MTLSNHADEAYHALADKRQQRIAEVLFRCLTERGPNGRDVRRPVSVREVAEVAGVSTKDVREVVDAFRHPERSFLLPSYGVRLTDGTILDITHESLIRQWERLRDWVEAEAGSARTYQRLEDAARRWKSREEGYLRPPRLDLDLKWREIEQPTAAWARRYGDGFKLTMRFLDRSQRKREETIAQQHEAAQERERSRIKAARRARTVIVGFALFLVLTVAGVLGLWDIRVNTSILEESAKDSFYRQVDFAAKTMEEATETLQNDTQGLHAQVLRFPALLSAQEATAATEEEAIVHLERRFEDLLRRNENYVQARFLNRFGLEVVRVERHGDEIRRNRDHLDKGTRAYFLEMLKMKEGDIYFSNVELNRERGGILSKPLLPVFRVARPVYVSDQRVGFVIINWNFSKVVKSEFRELFIYADISMVDEEGYFLYNQNDPQLEFGFDLIEERTTPTLEECTIQTQWKTDLAKLFPKGLQPGEGTSLLIDSDDDHNGKFLYTRQVHFDPKDSGRFIGLAATKSVDEVMKEVKPRSEEFRNSLVLRAIGLLFGSVVLGMLVRLLIPSGFEDQMLLATEENADSVFPEDSSIEELQNQTKARLKTLKEM